MSPKRAPQGRGRGGRPLVPLEHLLCGAWLALLVLPWFVRFASARQRWHADAAEVVLALLLVGLTASRRAGSLDVALRVLALVLALVDFLYVDPHALGLQQGGDPRLAMRAAAGLDVAKVLVLSVLFFRSWR